jgi:hypothetical protein
VHVAEFEEDREIANMGHGGSRKVYVIEPEFVFESSRRVANVRHLFERFFHALKKLDQSH